MSEMYEPIILPEAQKDIREIVLYIARELSAPQAALSLEEQFHETIDSLRKNPQRIKTVDDQPWKDAGIRKIKVKNYYIYFIIDDEEMQIKVNAVIYVGRNQVRQMEERGM